ncbi:Uncharacterised protein [Macrococcoides caseolyticum]|nr:Uncharacterised protein [Macrococcus caseolyticus]
MNKIKSTLIINISQVFNIIFSLLFQLLLLKCFGIEFVGSITSNIALVNVLSNLFCFGLGNYLISKFANNYQKIYSYKRAIYKYIAITGILSFTLMILIGKLYGNYIFISLSFFTMLLSLSITSVLSSFQQLNQQFIKLALVLSLVPFVRFLSLCISIYFKKNEFIFLLSIDILCLAVVIYSFKCVHNYLSSVNTEINKPFSALYKEVIPYGILNFCFIIYTNSAIVIMGLYGYNKYSVYISTSFLFVNCILMIPTIIVQKIYAVEVYNLILLKSIQIFEIRKKLIRLLLIYGTLTIIIYLLIGDNVIRMIFNDKSLILIESLNILFFSLYIKLINLIHSLILSSPLFVKTRVRFEILVCIIQVILIYILTGYLNYYYMLWVLVFIDVIWFVGYYLLVEINLKGNKYEKDY